MKCGKERKRVRKRKEKNCLFAVIISYKQKKAFAFLKNQKIFLIKY